MDTKYKVGIAVVVVLASFAAGRFLTPEKVRIETKIVEVEKKVDTEDKKNDTHKHTVIVKKTNKDGTSTTTTDVTYEDKTETKKNDVVTDNKSTDRTKEVTSGSSRVTLSALVGVSVTTGLPVYGASLSKPVLGPLTLGIWGLNNGTCGGSVGFTF